ncbi:hypothetical protein M758_4G035700 [Ceratodon purpureus]|nr:hypothetical protein M758_4G035700 [Ceratodon purpureus]
MVAMASSDMATLGMHDQTQHQAGQQSQSQSRLRAVMQRLERWVFFYNVTTGLYMLDWWERCIFNVVFLVFLLEACYNSGHYLCRLGAGLVAWSADDSASRGIWDGLLGAGGGVRGVGGAGG